MSMKGIYIIKNTTDGKFYVGSSKNINKRFRSHLNSLKRNKHHNRYLQNAFNKYGEMCFEFDIVFCVFDESDLHPVEENFIQSLSPEYNIGTVGGGDIYSTLTESQQEQIRKRQSICSKSWWNNLSEEDRYSLCQSRRGETNSNFGNKWSDEQREHLSKVVTERFRSCPEVKEHISKKAKERWKSMSEEELNKFKKMRSEAMTGEGNNMWGVRLSDESIKRGVETRRKLRISKIEETGEIPRGSPVFVNGVRYPSIGYASECLSVGIPSLYRRLTSSRYLNYFFEDIDKKYDPIEMYVVIVTLPDGTEICFNGIPKCAAHFGVHRESIRRFIRDGISEKSHLVGHHFKSENILFEQRHPTLKGALITPL